MQKKAILFLSLSLLFFVIPIKKLFADSNKTTAETVVHLISYISMDYAGAVERGEIINEQEYIEQQEFSRQAFNLTQESSFTIGETKDKLLSEIQYLIELIDQRAPEDQITKLANQINNIVIIESGIRTSPQAWPSLSEGKKLFAIHCSSCHGEKGYGDGIGGKSLEPAPTNFHDADLMRNLSAYQAYNSIRLGVPGTAMQATSNLNEREVWDLAFYVKSIVYEEQAENSGNLKKQLELVTEKVGLEDLAFLNDQRLVELLDSLGYSDIEQKIIAIRTQESESKGNVNSLPIAKQGLLAALDSYKSGDKKMAKNKAINAYLEGVEPVEARLRAISTQFVTRLETQMFNVRQSIEKDLSIEVVEKEVNKAIQLLDEADHLLGGHKLSYWLAYLIALSIMLREALEAFLIIAIAITLIRSTKVKGALKWLHAGWISAVVMGLVGWFLVDYIIQFGGKNRELMEGLVSIFAVVILIFAGFWLHDKTYASKWSKFVNEKIGGYLKKESMYGLAFFSFMVVFREAFEVILFLQAIQLDAGVENKSAIGLGALTAVGAIAIIAYVFLNYTKKMPLQYIFKYSSWMILILSVILIGKGVHSLQEAGWISHYGISFIRVDWLGIYPSLQTISAQSLLIAFIFVIYWISDKRNTQTQKAK